MFRHLRCIRELFTVFDETQFQELALGLERTNMPFLWVVREHTGKSYPEGFEQRVENRGKIRLGASTEGAVASFCVVLREPLWMEFNDGGCEQRNGVRFFCWPYFADQFIDESYICDYWRVGLRTGKDKSGIIKQEEIKNKVEQLLSDE